MLIFLMKVSMSGSLQCTGSIFNIFGFFLLSNLLCSISIPDKCIKLPVDQIGSN